MYESNELTVFTENILHLVYPPKSGIGAVVDFSWGDCNTLEKLETIVM